MYLLLAVVHHEELLDGALSALVELELPDSVVVETRTGLELLERDLPIFAGIRSLIPGGIDFSRLILCLVEDGDHAEEALQTLAGLGDGAARPGEPRNAVFLVPVSAFEFF